ncbi:MAG: efflux RND transporter permease subunit [Blastocatellia bacterium]|nr:efflux RND transporter permease subunit [Blastocatellia bacterium]
MAHGKNDNELIAATRNSARFFTENRHISWVLLIATMLWGVYGYMAMPKRKDPVLPLHYVVALCPWPGAGAEKIEQMITRRIEEKIAENSKVDQITSIAHNGVTVVEIRIQESVSETAKEFDDLKVRLDSLRDLPEGAGPIQFFKDFGQTAALMLTVASPKVNEVEMSLRAAAINASLAEARSGATAGGAREALVLNFPEQVNAEMAARLRDLLSQTAVSRGAARDPRPIGGAGFIGFDATTAAGDPPLLEFAQQVFQERSAELHPDLWPPIVVRDPGETQAKLRAIAGDKYSYRQLDDFTELIKRTLQNVPQVSKVARSGVLTEQIVLEYSQQRLASLGTPPSLIGQVLGARNISLPGGAMEVEGKNLAIDPSGEFKTEKEIGDVLVTTSSTGTPVYLRDAVNIHRGYESPPRFLNFLTARDASGAWQRTRSITLAVNMREGEQIGEFGQAVDAALATIRERLPEDLAMARTSDQPQQVREDIGLFTRSLNEAILLVVLVALIGFWEWRSALLIAASIPLTLAMSFGMMRMMGLDLQQVSVSTLILALGLLVDDPVVAGDAIKRELAAGHPPGIAAWLGPTKLANAILFATLTNIVAYLPFLMISGDMGRFLYALPVVTTITLVASRVVTMTFIPLLGAYLLRPGKRPDRTIEERRSRGFSGLYYRVGGFGIDHRWMVLLASTLILVGGLFLFTRLESQLFPDDDAYLSYIEVWLPEDATLTATNETAARVETIVREVAEKFGREHPAKSGEAGRPREILESITTFVGGGGPRFWYSVAPEMMQLNYAQVLLRVKDKHDSQPLAVPLQQALAARVPGAMIDVRQLKSGKNVGIPVSYRVSGQEISVLRDLAGQVKAILGAIPKADRIRDDWGVAGMVARLQIDPDRATLANMSNLDVAMSSLGGLSGLPVTMLREGDRQIPVKVRMRREERAQLSDLDNLYVYSMQGTQKTPLRQVSTIEYQLQPEKLWRLNQFRTITISCFPVPGALASQVFAEAEPRIQELVRRLPPGYRLETGGEQEERGKGFGELGVVMLVIVGGIFLMLVLQFRNAVKPLVVYAAIPFGIVGAILGLAVTGTPFGFIAFLGIASLIGVIVSHIIVLFDFIEEMRERGAPLRDALLDAGIVRLRPVMITVGATVFGLIPLALNGGPLWEPLCYAQIGGLIVANYITKLLVPALYAVCVLDLKIIRWDQQDS